MGSAATFAIAFLGSFLGVLCSAILLFFFARRRGRQRLDHLLDEYSEILRARLKEGVEEAGRDLLPEFRDQVRQGFKEGLADVLHGELLDQTARSIAKSGAGIMETGLNLLTGRRPKDEPRPTGE